jgi:hypothetical protein
MFKQFEEKGKIFTNVVTKRPVPVHIHTNNQLIRGIVHIRPDERLKDELNAAEMFIAVTEAKVYDLSGMFLYHCSFLALNRQHIVWLFQDDEAKAIEGEA